MAALNHPHIVTIYSIEDAHASTLTGPFITMELVEGRSLDRVLADGLLPLDRFFDIASALADALSAAHRKGIVHRDVKPANVMVPLWRSIRSDPRFQAILRDMNAPRSTNGSGD